MTKAAEAVLNDDKKAMLDSKRWSSRGELHQEIVQDTVLALENYTSSYVFNALAFLPDNRTDRQCVQFPEGRVVEAGYGNLNFFVLYANSSSNETAEEAWERLKDDPVTRDSVLNDVFAKRSGNLCGRLADALRDNGVDVKNFRGGFAAVKCGYEFVWYELGYTYFYAAYSSTRSKWQKNGGAYDAKCGQLFFFP
ncbi:hypothetical protein AAVH_21995 [Aphelenchoides avenae]|nr:hypothetical protein AAVH_21995 [Aphelenchus avenae]